jgi:transposase
MEEDVQQSILTEERQQELHEAVRSTEQARVYRRLKAVQLVAEGYPIEEVARLCEVGRASVYRFVRGFIDGGPTALEDAPRSGRPPKLPPEYRGGDDGRAAWQRLLARRPATIPELDTPSHIWTLVLLARYMQVVHEVTVAEATIYNALSRAGFRRGRTKLTVTSPDPDYEVKRRRIEALGKAPGRGS